MHHARCNTSIRGTWVAHIQILMYASATKYWFNHIRRKCVCVYVCMCVCVCVGGGGGGGGGRGGASMYNIFFKARGKPSCLVWLTQNNVLPCLVSSWFVLYGSNYTIPMLMTVSNNDFNLPVPCSWGIYIYILCLIIIIKSEVWIITHCLGLGHEIMVCVICLSKILWICDMTGLLRGTFVPWWYLPRIWPSFTGMQHYYHARYATDDWHLAYMCLLVYLSVEVYLEGVFPHSVSTRRAPCVRVYAPLTLATPSRENKIEQGCSGSPLVPSEGAFAWVCLHYWVVIWVAG